ncbi:hypothetical protein [Plantactinospora sp. DSM 117369]
MSLADPVGPGRRTDRREAVSFTIELLIAGNIATTHHLASSMKLLAEVFRFTGDSIPSAAPDRSVTTRRRAVDPTADRGVVGAWTVELGAQTGRGSRGCRDGA